MERCLPALVWHLEDPRVGQSYPNYYVARLASKFVKVVLVGRRRRRALRRLPVALLPRGRQRRLRATTSRSTTASGTGWSRTTCCREFFRAGRLERGRGPADDRHLPRRASRTHAPPESPEEYVNHSLYLEAKTFLHGLLRRRGQAQHGAQPRDRVPFLDNDLVDFAQRLPVRLKLRDLGEVVRAQRERARPEDRSATSSAPATASCSCARSWSATSRAEVTDQVKQGFSGPDASWFRGESIDYVRRRAAVDRCARSTSSSTPTRCGRSSTSTSRAAQNRRLLLWSLLTFEHWCRTFLGGERPG